MYQDFNLYTRSFRHRTQKTLWDVDKPLKRKDLHPYWWLNSLEPSLQPVTPWSRNQPPSRGRPKNPHYKSSQFKSALSNLAEKEKSNTQELILDMLPNISMPSSQPNLKTIPKKRQCKNLLRSDHAEKLLPNIASHTSASSSQPYPTLLLKKWQYNHPLHLDPIEEPRPSTSLSQLNSKSLPKKRQYNPPLPPDPPTYLSEREKEIKACAEDKLL